MQSWSDDERRVRGMLMELSFYRSALAALILEQPTKMLVVPKDQLNSDIALHGEIVKDVNYSIDFVRLQVRSQGKIIVPETEGV
jgi:hypothetical protein